MLIISVIIVCSKKEHYNLGPSCKNRLHMVVLFKITCCLVMNKMNHAVIPVRWKVKCTSDIWLVAELILKQPCDSPSAYVFKSWNVFLRHAFYMAEYEFSLYKGSFSRNVAEQRTCLSNGLKILHWPQHCYIVILGKETFYSSL